MFNFKSILLPEQLRILFWTCIGALAVFLDGINHCWGVFPSQVSTRITKTQILFYSLLYMCGWVFVLIYSLPKRTKKVT